MRNRFTNLGWFITLIIALVPILFALVGHPQPPETTKTLLENLGKLCGLAGFALFTWSVILSARLKVFGRLFMGLDNMYRAHHIIACVGLVLILFHPMFLTSRYLLSSLISAYEFVKPSFESPFRFLGEFTLACFMLLMLMVLFLKLQQKRLVLIMRIMGALVFLGFIHAYLVGGSDISSILPLQIYMFGLVGLAAFVYVYRSIFHGNLQKYHEYSIGTITHKGDIIELHLSSQQESIDYLPGQFAFFKPEAKGILGESHPFTISQAPTKNQLRFSIKQQGDFTNALSEFKPGQKVKIDAPYGSFSNRVVTNQRQVWVAGGIGVTPFLAMASALERSQQIDLYYSLKNKSEAVYLDELQKDANKVKGLKVIPHFADQGGFLTAETIFNQSTDLSDAAFLICGPPAMMKALRSQLRSYGIPNKNIHTEEFSLQ